MSTPLCKCRVLYIGSSVPTISKDGLRGIQEPLRERYPMEGNNATDARGIDSWLSVWSNGLLLEYTQEGESNEQAFFPMQTLHYCAAVRYVNVSGYAVEGGGEKFLPLDSPFAAAAATNHPPIFAAIFRRTQGVKVLECHAFICTNDRAANALVRCCFHAYADNVYLKNEGLLSTDAEGKLQPVGLDQQTSRSTTPKSDVGDGYGGEDSQSERDVFARWSAENKVIGAKTWQRRQQTGEYETASISSSLAARYNKQRPQTASQRAQSELGGSRGAVVLYNERQPAPHMYRRAGSDTDLPLALIRERGPPPGHPLMFGGPYPPSSYMMGPPPPHMMGPPPSHPMFFAPPPHMMGPQPPPHMMGPQPPPHMMSPQPPPHMMGPQPPPHMMGHPGPPLPPELIYGPMPPQGFMGGPMMGPPQPPIIEEPIYMGRPMPPRSHHMEPPGGPHMGPPGPHMGPPGPPHMGPPGPPLMGPPGPPHMGPPGPPHMVPPPPHMMMGGPYGQPVAFPSEQYDAYYNTFYRGKKSPATLRKKDRKTPGGSSAGADRSKRSPREEVQEGGARGYWDQYETGIYRKPYLDEGATLSNRAEQVRPSSAAAAGPRRVPTPPVDYDTPELVNRMNGSLHIRSGPPPTHHQYQQQRYAVF